MASKRRDTLGVKEFNDMLWDAANSPCDEGLTEEYAEKLRDSYAALHAHLTKLREAAKGVATKNDHVTGCGSFTGRPFSTMPCTCGLEDLRSALAEIGDE